MTRAQALKLARAKWGEQAHLRYNRHANTKDIRAAIQQERKAHRKAVPTWGTTEYRKWRRHDDELLSGLLAYPYEIGRVNIIAFSVEGFGDSWEEACRKAGLIP